MWYRPQANTCITQLFLEISSEDAQLAWTHWRADRGFARGGVSGSAAVARGATPGAEQEGARLMVEGAGGPTVLRIPLETHLRRLRPARRHTAHNPAHGVRGSESKARRNVTGRAPARGAD